MLRILTIVAMLGASSLAMTPSSFASDDGEVKLSKKERKALAAKNSKLGRMASMCIGSLAMSTLDDEAIKETPKFKASNAFWTSKLDESVSHVKLKKQTKLRDSYRQQGSAALTSYGNGNIILGGKKASVVCDMVETEGLKGPTAAMLMGG